MRHFRTALTVLFLVVYAYATPHAGQLVTIEWDANTESDLDGYRLYQRTESTVYDYENPVADIEETMTSHSLDMTVEGEYRWIMRVYDKSGNESIDSNEVGHRVDFTAPSAAVIRIIVP
jgi:hypothetical protein